MFKLKVLNPFSIDPRQEFTNYAGDVNDTFHAPINWHAYAACSSGVFCKDVLEIQEKDNVLFVCSLTVVEKCFNVFKLLKNRGIKVVVAFKPSGTTQIAQHLSSAEKLHYFQLIVQEADACLAPTEELLSVFRSIRLDKDPETVCFIPTPYPIEDVRWNFSLPLEQKRGIFIGTREFHILARNHLAALLMASAISNNLNCHVTVINPQQRKKTSFFKKKEYHNLFDSLNFKPELLKIIPSKLPYSEYLKLMSSHRIVLQADQTTVPGQVAGDSLLCRMPCVGGVGAVERLVFSDLCGFGKTLGELQALAQKLLTDNLFYNLIIEKSQEEARKKISFSAVFKKLDEFYSKLKIKK